MPVHRGQIPHRVAPPPARRSDHVARQFVAGAQAEPVDELLADVYVIFRSQVARFPAAQESHALAGQLQYAQWCRFSHELTIGRSASLGGCVR
jgi:hypothetical protein